MDSYVAVQCRKIRGFLNVGVLGMDDEVLLAHDQLQLWRFCRSIAHVYRVSKDLSKLHLQIANEAIEHADETSPPETIQLTKQLTTAIRRTLHGESVPNQDC